jgi:hypothetical protein
MEEIVFARFRFIERCTCEYQLVETNARVTGQRKVHG